MVDGVDVAWRREMGMRYLMRPLAEKFQTPMENIVDSWKLLWLWFCFSFNIV